MQKCTDVKNVYVCEDNYSLLFEETRIIFGTYNFL